MRKYSFARTLFVLVVAFAVMLTGISLLFNMEFGKITPPDVGEGATVATNQFTSKNYPSTDDYIVVSSIGQGAGSTRTFIGTSTGAGNAPYYKADSGNAVMLIGTANEFLWMMQNTSTKIRTNLTNNTELGVNGKTVADRNSSMINAQNIQFELTKNFLITAVDWQEVYSGSRFNLKLDGNGKTIMFKSKSSLTQDSALNTMNQGAFMGVNSGEIKNLNYIYHKESYFFANRWDGNAVGDENGSGIRASGFLGKNAGKITNCRFTIDGIILIANQTSADICSGGTLGENAGTVDKVVTQFGGSIQNRRISGGGTDYTGSFVGNTANVSNTISNVIMLGDENGRVYTNLPEGSYARHHNFSGEAKNNTTITLIKANGLLPSIKTNRADINTGAPYTFSSASFFTQAYGTDQRGFIKLNQVALLGYENTALDELQYGFDDAGNVLIKADKKRDYYVETKNIKDTTINTSDPSYDTIFISKDAVGAHATVNYLKDLKKPGTDYVSITNQKSWNRYANVVNANLFASDNYYRSIATDFVNKAVVEADLLFDGNIFVSIGDSSRKFYTNTSGANVLFQAGLKDATFDFNNHGIMVDGSIIGVGHKRGFFGDVIGSTIKNAKELTATIKYTYDPEWAGDRGYGGFVSLLQNSTLVNIKKVNISNEVNYVTAETAILYDKPNNDGDLDVELTLDVGGFVGFMVSSGIQNCEAKTSVAGSLVLRRNTGQGYAGRLKVGGSIGAARNATFTGSTLEGSAATSEMLTLRVYAAGVLGSANRNHYGYSDAKTITFSDCKLTGTLNVTMQCWRAQQVGGIFNEINGTVTLERTSMVTKGAAAVSANDNIDGGAGGRALGGMFSEVRASSVFTLNSTTFAEESGYVNFHSGGSTKTFLITLGSWVSEASTFNASKFWLIRKTGVEGQSIMGGNTGNTNANNFFNNTSNKLYLNNIDQGNVDPQIQSDGTIKMRFTPTLGGSPFYDGSDRQNASTKSNLGLRTASDAAVGDNYVEKIVLKTTGGDGVAISKTHKEYYQATEYFLVDQNTTGQAFYATFAYSAIREMGELSRFAGSMKNKYANKASIYAELISGNGQITGTNGAAAATVTVGSVAAPFKGTFEGNNKKLKITNLSQQGANETGLFAAIDTGAIVRNFTMEISGNIAITTNSGNGYAGTVAGLNKGTIDNVQVLSSGYVSVQSLSANIADSYTAVGGFVGENNGGTISNCSVQNNNKFAITNSSDNVAKQFFGGFVGKSISGTYSNSSMNFKNVEDILEMILVKSVESKVGGVFGEYSGNNTMANCVFSIPNKVMKITSGSSAITPYAFGYNNGSMPSTGSWLAITRGAGYIPPTAANLNTMWVENESGIENGAVVVSVVDEGGVKKVRFISAVDNFYSVGGWENELGKVLTKADGANGIVYTHQIPNLTNKEYKSKLINVEISTEAQFKEIAKYVNAGNSFSGVIFKITASFTLNNFAPMGTATNPFSGRINGGYNTITMQNVQEAAATALIGYLKGDVVTATSGATTKNYSSAGVYDLRLVVKSSSIGSKTASANSAVLVAVNEGGYIGVYPKVSGTDTSLKVDLVKAPINISIEANTTISAVDNAAIVVGRNVNNGELIATVSYVNVVVAMNDLSKYYSVTVETTGAVSNAAGFIGENQGKVSNCYASIKTLNFGGGNGSGFIGSLTSTAEIENILIDIDAIGDFAYYVSKSNNASSIKNAWVVFNKGVRYSEFDETLIDSKTSLGASSDFNILLMAGLSFRNDDVNFAETVLKDNGMTVSVRYDKNNIGFYGFVNDLTNGNIATGSDNFTLPANTKGFLGAMVFAKMQISKSADLVNIDNYSRSFAGKKEIPIVFDVVSSFDFDMTSVASSAAIANFYSTLESKNSSVITLRGTVKPLIGNLFGKVDGVKFVVSNTATVANATKFAPVASNIEANGKVNNVTVDIETSMQTATEGAGVAVNNAGIISKTTVNIRAKIVNDKFSGISSLNEGSIVEATVNVLSGASFKAGEGVAQTAVFSAITAENRSAISNSTVLFSGGVAASNKPVHLSGVTNRNAATASIVNTTVTFNSATLASEKNVTNISGLAATQEDGATIRNSVVNISSSLKAKGWIAGAVGDARGEMNGITLNIGTTSVTAIAPDIAFAGLAYTSNAANISNTKVNYTSQNTVISGDIGGLIVTNNASIINNVVIDMQSKLTAMGRVAGIAVEQREGTITNVVALIKNQMTGANVASGFVLATGSNFALNSWVARSNKFYYPVNKGDNNTGLNDLRVLDKNGTLTANIVDGEIVISISAGLGTESKWYSNVDERVVLDTSSLVTIEGNKQIFKPLAGSTGNQYALSYFDLDVDGKNTDGTAYSTGVDAEFANFMSDQNRYNVFFGILLKLHANVEVNDGNFLAQIGTQDKPFNGVFDGQGNTITLKRKISGVNSGLFDTIAKDGIVKNFVLNIETSMGGSVSNNVGALVGRNFGTIDSVAVVIQNNTDISKWIKFTGAAGANIGIIAGTMETGSNANNVWAVAIRADYFKPVGNNVKNGINSMSIFGTSTLTATMAADGAGQYYITFDAPLESLDGWYSDYATGQVIDTPVKNQYTADATLRNRDYVISYITRSIYTEADLINLSNIINYFDIKGDETFTLMNDITIGNGVDRQIFNPIGSNDRPFNGNFVGGGHTITISENVAIGGATAGLFGKIGGNIKNLRLVINTTLLGDESSSQIGGLVANCQGTLQNVVVEMNKIPDVIKGEVSDKSVGGIAGTYNTANFATNVWFISCSDKIAAVPNANAATYFNTISIATAKGQIGNLAISGGLSGNQLTLNASGDNFYGFINQANPTERISSKTHTFTAGEQVLGIKYFAAFVVTELQNQGDFDNFVAQMADEKDLNLAGVEYNLRTNIEFRSLLSKQINAIGSETNKFKGIFNGNGHLVTVPADTTVLGKHAGLFGFTDTTAALKNIILDFKGSIGDATTTNAAPLVGYSDGTVSNCAVKLNLALGNKITAKTKGNFVGFNGSRVNYVGCWVVAENTSSLVADLLAGGQINAYNLKYMVAIGNDFALLMPIFKDGKIAFETTATKYYWYDTAELLGKVYVPNADTMQAFGSSYKLIITSSDEFIQMQKDVAEGKELTGISFVLANSITLSGNILAIGNNVRQFNATFNGNGNTITLDASITSTATASVGGYAGLFGYVGVNGTVNNLAIKMNSTLTAINKDANGNVYAGAIAYNAGKIENVLVIAGDDFKIATEATGKANVGLFAGGSTTAIVGSWAIYSSKNVQIATPTKKGVNTMTLLNEAGINFSYRADAATKKFSLLLDGSSTQNKFYTDFNSSAAVTAGVSTEGVKVVYNYSELLSDANYQAIVFKNEIADTLDLNRIAYDVNAGYTYRDRLFTINASFEVTSGLVASIGVENSTIKGFEGRINANNNTLTISTNVPLFGNILASARIENLKVMVDKTIAYDATDSKVLAPFALNNSGTISNVDVTIAESGKISGGNVAGFIAKNTGSIVDFKYEMNGELSAKTIAGFVYYNSGTIKNSDKTNIVYINGRVKALNTSGNSFFAGLVYRNEAQGEMSYIRVWYGGRLVDEATNSVDNVASTVSVSGSGTAIFAGIVGINFGVMDITEYRYCEMASITAKSVYGLVEQNRNTAKNIAGAIAKEKTSKIFNSQNVVLDGSGTTFLNSWIAMYANADNSTNYITTNGSNKVVVIGSGSIVLKLNTVTMAVTAEQKNAEGYDFGGWYKNSEKITQGVTDGNLTTPTTDVGQTYELVFIKTTLYNVDDLIEFSNNVNSGVVLEKDTLLGANIIVDKPLNAIGTLEKPFKGVFKSVNEASPFKITIATNMTGDNYAGLFGYIASSAKISGIDVEIATNGVVGAVTSTMTGGFAAKNEGNVTDVRLRVEGKLVGKQVGGFVSENSGVISRIEVTMTKTGRIEASNAAAGVVATQVAIEGAKIENVVADISGGITATADAAGFIVRNEAEISGITFKGEATIAGARKGAFAITNSSSIKNTTILTSADANIIASPSGLSIIENVLALSTSAVAKTEQSGVNVVIVPSISDNVVTIDSSTSIVKFDFDKVAADKFIIVKEFVGGTVLDSVLGITSDASQISFGSAGNWDNSRIIEVLVTDTVKTTYEMKFVMQYANTNTKFQDRTIKLGANITLDKTFDALNMAFDGAGYSITTEKQLFATNNKDISNLVINRNTGGTAIVSGQNTATIKNVVINFDILVESITENGSGLFANGGVISECAVVSYKKDYVNTSAQSLRIVGAGKLQIAYAMGVFVFTPVPNGEFASLVKTVEDVTSNASTYYFMTTLITDSKDFFAIQTMLNDIGLPSDVKFKLGVDELVLAGGVGDTAISAEFNASFDGNGGKIIYAGTLFANVSKDNAVIGSGTIKNLIIDAKTAVASGTGSLYNVIAKGGAGIGSDLTLSNSWVVIAAGTGYGVSNANVNIIELSDTIENSFKEINYSIAAGTIEFTANRTQIASDKIFGGFQKGDMLLGKVVGSAASVSEKYTVTLISKTIMDGADWNRLVLASDNDVLSTNDVFVLGADIVLDNTYNTLGVARAFKAVLDGVGKTIYVADGANATTFTKTLIENNAGTVKNLLVRGNAADTTKIIGFNSGTVANVWSFANRLQGNGVSSVVYSDKFAAADMSVEFIGGKFIFGASNNDEIIMVKNKGKSINTNQYAKYSTEIDSKDLSIEFTTIAKVGDVIEISTSKEYTEFTKALSEARLNPSARVALTSNIEVGADAVVGKNNVNFDGRFHTLTIGSNLFSENSGSIKDVIVVLTGDIAATLIGVNQVAGSIDNIVVDAQRANSLTNIAGANDAVNSYIITRNANISFNGKVAVTGTESGKSAATVMFNTELAKYEVVATEADERALVGYFEGANKIEDASKVTLDGRNYEVRFIKNVVRSTDEYNALASEINTFNTSINIKIADGIKLDFRGKSITTLLNYKGTLDGNMNVIYTDKTAVIADGLTGKIKDLMVFSDVAKQNYASGNDNLVVKGNSGTVVNVWVVTANDKIKAGLGVSRMLVQDDTSENISLLVSVRTAANKSRYFELSATGLVPPTMYGLKWMSNSDNASDYRDDATNALPTSGFYEKYKLVISKYNAEPITLTSTDLKIIPIDKDYDASTAIDYNVVLGGILTGESVDIKSSLIMYTGDNLSSANANNNVPVRVKHGGSGKVIFRNTAGTKAFSIDVTSDIVSNLTVNISKRDVNLNVIDKRVNYVDIAAMRSDELAFSMMNLSEKDKELLGGTAWKLAFIGSLFLRQYEGGVFSKETSVGATINAGRYYVTKGTLSLAPTYQKNFNLVFGDNLSENSSVSTANANLLATLGNIVVKIADYTNLEHRATYNKNNLTTFFSVTGASAEIIKQIQRVIDYDLTTFMVLNGNDWIIRGDILPGVNYAITEVESNRVNQREGYTDIVIEAGIVRLISTVLNVSVTNNSHTYFVETIKVPTVTVNFGNSRYSLTLKNTAPTGANETAGEYPFEPVITDSLTSSVVTKFFGIVWKGNSGVYTIKVCEVEVTFESGTKTYGSEDMPLNKIYRDKNTRKVISHFPIAVVGEPKYGSGKTFGEGNSKAPVGAYTMDENFSLEYIKLAESDKTKNFKLYLNSTPPTMNVKKATAYITIKDMAAEYGTSLPEFKDLATNLSKYISVVNGEGAAISDMTLWPSIKLDAKGNPVFKLCGSDDITDVIMLEGENGVVPHLEVGLYYLIGEFESNNFTVKVTSGKYTVEKRKVTIGIEGSDYKKGYAQDFDQETFKIKIGGAGLAPNDKELTVLAALNLAFKWNERLGVVDIVIDLFDNNNYEITNMADKMGSMLIEKAKLKITIKGNTSKQLGAEDPSINFEINGNVVDGDLSGGVYRKAGEEKGFYEIYHNFTWDADLYDIEVVIEADAKFEIKNDDVMKTLQTVAIATGCLVAAIALLVIAIVVFKKRKPIRMAAKMGVELPPTKKELKNQAFLDKKEAKKQARKNAKKNGKTTTAEDDEDNE